MVNDIFLGTHIVVSAINGLLIVNGEACSAMHCHSWCGITRKVVQIVKVLVGVELSLLRVR